MEPFRKAMSEELGFGDVETHGTSGNILFTAPLTSAATLEKRIADRFRTDAFVRSAVELAKIVANDPLGGVILFLAKPPALARREAFGQLDFEGRRPVLRGATLYFRYPTRLGGKKTPFDFEEFLGVRGTARSARVVKTIAEKLGRSRVLTKPQLSPPAPFWYAAKSGHVHRRLEKERFDVDFRRVLQVLLHGALVRRPDNRVAIPDRELRWQFDAMCTRSTRPVGPASLR